MKYTAQQLVDYILSHDHYAWVVGGRIMAIDSWMGMDSRVWVDEIIMLPTEVDAVRRWLGY